MTTIYGVWSGDGSVFFPTKAAAMREARSWAKDMIEGDTADVTEYTVAKLPKRELYCCFLNGHWAADMKLIASVEGKRPMDRDA